MADESEGGEFEVDLDELRALILVGDIDEAVELYELAPPGTWELLLARLEDAPDEAMRNAAVVFERARDFSHAGVTFQDAGDPAAAGASFESDGRYESAAESFTEAGDLTRAAWALARAGHPFEAAETFRDAEDSVNELLMLKQVPDDDPDYDQALRRLAEIQPHDEKQAVSANDAGAFRTLKNIPLFAQLSLQDMRDLFDLCEQKTFVAGEHLLHRGQPATGLYAIVEGDVVVTQSTRELNSLSAGAHLGEMGLVRDAPVSADVMAKTKVTALFVPREPFERFLASRHDAALRLYKLFALVLADLVADLSKRAD